MADPRRLIDDPDSSPIARSLLAAAGDDAPSPASRVRLARRLGITTALAAGAGAGSEAGAAAIVWKVAAVVLALGGAAGLAIWRAPDRVSDHRARSGISDVDHDLDVDVDPHLELDGDVDVDPIVDVEVDRRDVVPDEDSAAADDRLRARSTMESTSTSPSRSTSWVKVDVKPNASAVGPGPSSTPRHATLPPPASPLPPPQAVSLTSEPAPSRTEPTPAAADPRRLAAEVALVDRARALLAAHDATAALAALAEYHQRFAGGDLDAESDVVTIEAEIARNAVARARALGAAFLTRFPRSPHARRVRSLVERLPPVLPDHLPDPPPDRSPDRLPP